MSTIRVDNFTPSGGGTSFSRSGISKAWLKYNQNTVTKEGSLNVSSVTDSETGIFQAIYINIFAAVDYSCVISTFRSGSTIRIAGVNQTNIYTGSVQIATVDVTNALVDTSLSSFNSTGDLA
jgi:hypothetical protein